MGRITLLALSIVASVGVAAVAAQPQMSGRTIYEEGVIGIEASGEESLELPQAYRACAGCHGALGEGASEGGIAAPALTRARHLDEPALLAWLHRAMTEGRGADGRALSPVMPRYTVGRGELLGLAEYIASLPYPAQPGLTSTSIALGLDLRGSGFDAAEQAVLTDFLRSAVGEENKEGSLFGRTLDLAGDYRSAFFTISWRHGESPARPSLALTAPPQAASTGCVNCCGTAQASAEERLEWILRELEAAGAAPVVIPHSSEPESSDPGPVWTPIVSFAEAPAQPPHGAIFLTGGGLIPAWARKKPDAFLVSGFDLTRQIAEAEALGREDHRFAASPRLATAAIQLRNSLLLVFRQLEARGRSLSARQLCDDVRREARAAIRFSILGLSDGTVSLAPGRP